MKKNNFFFGPGFGTNLGLKFFLQVLPLLIIRHCSKPLRYAIYRKTNTPNLRKLQKKPLILDPILACLTQIWVYKFFFESFTSTVS